MVTARHKVGLVFFGRTRPGFDEEWGSAMAARVRTAMDGCSWETYACPTKAADDATTRRAVDECRTARCDTLVVLQTTMSDGRLAPILIQHWQKPLIFWATPERPQTDIVSSCSLVGTHLFASLAARMAVPFEVVNGDPAESSTILRLGEAVAATSLRARMGQTKVGLIGYHAPGFINVHADPYAIDRDLGAELYHTGQQDLLNRMEALDPEAVEADVARCIKLGMPLVDIQPDELKVQARYYLAIKSIMADEQLDALALRCWPELPNLTGQWPYLALVRLTDEGLNITMEGDVDGALGMLVMRELGIEPGFLTDWLEHDETHITTWHGGGTPACLAEPEGTPHARTIARHFNSNKPAVVDGWIKPVQPVTIMRMWGTPGGYRIMVREATTAEPTRHLRGTNGRIRLHDESAHQLFDACCQAGMPHHLMVSPGHHARILNRAARILGMEKI